MATMARQRGGGRNFHPKFGGCWGRFATPVSISTGCAASRFCRCGLVTPKALIATSMTAAVLRAHHAEIVPPFRAIPMNVAGARFGPIFPNAH